MDQKFVAMQRIYSDKTNERISQQKLKATNTGGLSDELQQRLVAFWKDLEQHVIDSAIDQWRRRLRACVRAKGGHFEHSLWINIAEN